VNVANTTPVVEDIDILNGTPLLDIKPYVPFFDAYPNELSGWLSGCRDRLGSVRSDTRFTDRDR
jgi:tRNA (Thr-GGU) A37 N-methylase